MKLGKNQPCPIPGHGRKCPCREQLPDRKRKRSKWEQVRPGVRRLADPNADHPDGFRYRLSASEMKKVVDSKILAQSGVCAICGGFMDDYSNIAPDHILPKGIGGSRRDDRKENIQAVHHVPCNVEKGSSR